ncbi:MAG: hypothetical protein AD742_16435 [Methylibium sp. NZG]|nr:MAG: hypothetical protein AD742_16435 [Methylibium sp. NZG]
MEAAARQQGLSKSQFVVDAVERALGRKDPYQLLLKVEEEMAPYRVLQSKTAERAASALARAAGAADAATGAHAEPTHHALFREALRAKHEAELREWEAHHGKQSAAGTPQPQSNGRKVDANTSARKPATRTGATRRTAARTPPK